jgi:hypothetical protein
VAKSYRILLDRVTGYADEASAFLKRRRLTRRPFARVYDANEVGHSFEPESEQGGRLFAAAAALIEAHRAEDSPAPE